MTDQQVLLLLILGAAAALLVVAGVFLMGWAGSQRREGWRFPLWVGGGVAVLGLLLAVVVQRRHGSTGER